MEKKNNKLYLTEGRKSSWQQAGTSIQQVSACLV
jgi:hypothetical protein